ncbi:ABC transporter permease [Mesorhizobium sp. CA8]|uniref:ABC transporter permease n=1 Tax=unclassified Mesorhizobium TaxID=325217 RepID=UPI001CCAD614|nr:MULTISPECIES: ABC transporter permease [unclassified Mesorhizobium]MBZ9761708.1 ABC transporter permease [Mesorhizobium sp. CA8]MBZ9820538.1 ABC transporter permease [Mesorhizobium sp. CA4]
MSDQTQPLLAPIRHGRPPVVIERIWRAVSNSLLLRSPLFYVGCVPVVLWCLVAIFAPLLTGYDPNAQDIAALSQPEPSALHLLGTDQLGRDVWARIAFGARSVLTIAPLSLLSSYAFGIVLGLASGYSRLIDPIVTKLCDVMLAFPVIVLYVVLITAIGPSSSNIIVAVTVSTAPAVARIVRGMVLDLKDREFVDAARIRNESGLYIMFFELLPNMVVPLLVDFCLRMGYTIIKIGSLGFLGLGLPPPDPDWGGMVKEGVAFMLVWPHISLVPCLAIASLVIGFNLVADAVASVARRA